MLSYFGMSKMQISIRFRRESEDVIDSVACLQVLLISLLAVVLKTEISAF